MLSSGVAKRASFVAATAPSSSETTKEWAKKNGIDIAFIQPGQPQQERVAELDVEVYEEEFSYWAKERRG